MSSTNVSTCAGNFYDSGGGGANYGLNQNTTMTLCSNTAGQCIRISFTAFNLENNFDFLRIYNGPNTASPLIGSYTGTTSPGVVTGTSGCLTFVFTSDGSINHAGWTASISCVTCAAGGSCLQTCNGGPAPVNDACSGAQNLGTLPAPAACPNGIGAWVNVSTTNLCATAEMPYTTLTGCNPSGNMASPASDVWYRLNLTGPTLNVQISGGIQTPNVALYSGTTCNNLIGRGCAIGAGGILNTTFGGLAAGTYFLQISGGSLTDQCDFNLALQNNFDCQGCVIVNNLVVNPPPVNGTYQAGQLVNFCYTISDYNQTSVNWLHAVVPTFGAGWDMSTLTTVMPANCSGSGAWGWYNTNITSSATGVIHGPGFYYESGLGSPLGFMDGNPGNNFGDNNATNSCNWTFCFSVRTMPASQCTQGASLNVSIDTYGDGESGSWTSLACTGDPVTDFFATLSCCQPPIVNPNNPLCDGYVGSANGIAQGASPWTYIWQNSAGGTIMQVNNINSAHAIPNLAAGNYSLTTIDNNGCSSTTYFSITTPPAIIIAANAVGTKCNSNNGAINIFANGGVAPLQYSIDNGTTFSAASTFNNLAAGSYTVVVKDANGCTSSQVVNVATSTSPVINNSPVTQVSCFGGNNGSIVVNASGGNPPLQFSIDNGTTYQTSNNFTSLTAGSYTVVVSDVDGCTSSVILNVTQPAQINISNIQTTDATCGNSNGSLVVTASGGTGVLQYSTTGGPPYQVSNTFNNLAALNYNVVVIDANGCTQTLNAQVNNSSAPVINTANASALLCNGDNNAAITINASGGTGVLQYSINNGTTFQSGNVFNGLAAGTYNVVVSDAAGCLVSTSVVITDPALLNVSANNVGTTCTQSNGSITVNGSGGTGTLQYAMNGGSYQASTNFNSLAAGNYTVTVQDANGCTASISSNVTDAPSAIIVNINTTPVSCNGQSDATIDIVANSGTAPLNYSIDNGLTFQVGSYFSGLPAGSYNIVVSDANGCTTTGSINVVEPTTLTLNLNATNTTCSQTNGSVSAAANGGTPAYQFSIDAGGTFQSSASFSGLATGVYSIVVQDANGCTASGSINLSDLPGPRIDNVVTVDINCNGANNGSVSVMASNGTAPLQYSIDNGTTYQSGNVFGSLSPGNYNIVVQDANGCTVTTTATVAEPTAIVISGTPVTDANCNGANNGSITINANGGTGTLQYSIDNGTTYQSGNNFSSLSPGNYNIVVQDANGCTATTTATIAEPTAVVISGTPVTDVNCNGANNGSITINANGGTGTLQYSIDNGTTYQSGNVFGSLTPGNYNIVVQDANGCTVTTTATIAEPTAVVISSTPVTDVNCNGANNGSITMNANGGTGTLQYSIDNGTTYQSGNVFGNLSPGSYNIIVQDANGCTVTTTATIAEPTAVVISGTPVTDANCNGANNGSITINANGGTGTLQYSIDNGTTYQSGNVFGSLTPGNYNIIVQDANGCTVTTTATIAEPTAVVISGTPVTDANCNGANNGSITINANGGTGTLQYSIDNGSTYQSGNVFGNLSPGNYNIVVQDANGCTVTTTATVAEPTVVVISGTPVTDANCNGANNGSITINANGGTGTLQYSIDNGTTYQSGNNFSSLSPGNYNIVVQDANGCTATTTATIAEPTAVVISGTPVTDVNCNGANNGSITINANGGTGTLQYSIDNGTTYQSGNVFGSLTPGNYNIVVQDANGCTVTTTATIAEPTAVVISSTPVTDVNCNGANNGSITMNANGGTGTLQYSIDNGTTYQSGNVFGNLSPGSYNIIVQDANGCTVTTTATITEPTALSYSSVVTDANCGNANGGVTINAAGGTLPIQYSIDNGTTFQSGNNFTGLLAGSYQVQLQDANGCTFSGVVSIQNLAAPVINQVVYSGLTCNASNDGTISINASGGVGTLQYSIDNGTTYSSNFNYSNLSSGNYSIIVQDGAGCQATFAVVITEPSVLIVSPIISNTTCTSANGSIVLNASGGTSPYSYSINSGANFQSQNNFNAIAAGNYTVVITDDNGCTVSQPVAVIDAPAPNISNVQKTDISCNGSSDGAFQILTNGGTAPLQYSSDNGLNYQALNNFSNLPAGNYNVIVQDANGCTVTTSIQLIQPSAIVLNQSATPSTCGNNDGTVTVTTSGGTGIFNFSIDNGLTYQSSNVFNQLFAGNYTVTVQDANGCTNTIAVAVNNLSAPSIQTVTQTDITCNGANNGTITLSANGGTGALSYSINNGTSYQASPVFQSLAPGNYNVVVQDGNGCTVTSTATIAEPLAIQINVTTTNTTCGNNNGTIDVLANGGTGSLTYSNDGGSINQASGHFGNVSAGTYQIVVTDGNGCTSTSQIIVTDAPSPVIANTPLVQISCNGLSDGAITINTLGGLAPLQFSIDNGINSQPSGLFGNLSPGNYQILVTDANGCTATTSAVLVQPLGIMANAATINANCGTADGAITIAASGGSGALQFSIDNGVSFQSASSFGFLTAGNYSVIIRDANGCTNTVTATVSNNSAPSISAVSATDITCFGAGNGVISVSANGGSGTLQYSIDNGATFQTSQIFNNVVAGNYTVVVQDAGGCTVTDVVSVTEPSMLNMSNTTSGSTCGILNGQINISANGGTAPFQFSIDSGVTFQSTATFSGLTSGTYQLQVQDANGCVINTTTQVANAPSPQINQVTHTDLTCFGSQNGTISIASSGGASPVMYSVDGGVQFQAGAVFSNLNAGSYQILIQDVNGCTATSSVVVTEPSAIAVTSVSTDATCGNSNGTLAVNTIGGSGILTYSIDSGLNFQSGSLFQNLLAGSYNLVVQDANGCTSSAIALVSNASAPVINAAPVTNVSCNGYNDGSIVIQASGGLGTLTYSINGGVTSFPGGIFNNLIAGSYNIIVTDSTGCSVTAVANISQPSAILSSTSVVNAICGSNNGAITITASGGVGTLQYSINNGGIFQAVNIFNNLGAGNYQVVVSDANGCTIGAVASISNANAPVIQSTNVTHVSCFGGNNGAIVINANGGTGVLQYSINNVVTYSLNNTYTNLQTGSYSIQVIDAAGCIATSNVVITEPDELLFNTTSTPATCGNANGQLTFNAIGGTAPLQYSMNNGSSFQSGVSFSGLTAANYSVVIQDANGCSSSAVATITNQAGPSIATVIANDVKCNGTANGVISISANGGTGILQYSINNGSSFQQGNIFSGLSTGIYQIVVKDANGCNITSQSIINEPDPILLTVIENGSTCSQPNGGINVSASGGTGVLQYSANNGISYQASSSFMNLSAGSYTVMVQDSNGCTSQIPATVTDAPAPVLQNIGVTNVLCYGNSDGLIQVQTNGGTGTLNYSLSNGDVSLSGIFDSLGWGNYVVSITDANGCSVFGNTTVTQPQPLNFFVNTTASTCGNDNGIITVNNVTGGTGVCVFSLDSGLTNQSQNQFVNMSAGNYSVLVTDSNGCSIQSNVLLANIAGPLFGTLNVTDALCSGSLNGSITVSPQGGTGPFLFSADSGLNYQAGNIFSALSAGNYNLIIQDANGCLSDSVATINEPLPLNYQVASAVATCGSSNGTITLNATGGSGSYQYSINNGITFQSTGTFGGLIPSVYPVVVTDVNGCLDSGMVSVADAPSPVLSLMSVNDATCNGYTDGVISVSSQSGTLPIQYNINGGSWQPSGNFNNLSSGNYSVIVQDGFGCTDTVTALIAEPLIIALQTSSTPVLCNGQSNGHAEVTVTGGTSPYSYQWNGGVTTAFVNNITSGAYSVIVTDANNCTSSASVVVTEPAALQMTLLTTPVTCFGYSNGVINTTASGGTGNLQYSIDTGATYQNANVFTSLSFGSYAIQVTDANGCTLSVPVSVTQPAAVSLMSSAIDVKCFGGNDGSLTLNTNGGTVPYQFVINNGNPQAGATFNNLTAGNYVISVTDSMGCMKTISDSVGQPTALNAVASGQNVLCNGQSNGAVNVVVTGGVQPYLYQWAGGYTTSLVNNLPQGSYQVTITDFNGCTIQSSANIAQPTAINLGLTPDPTICIGQSASVTANANGGTPPYVYKWNTGHIGATLQASPVITTTYNVFLTDSNGCNSPLRYANINVNPALALVLTDDDTLCEGQNTTLTATPSGGNGGPYSITWNGQTQPSASITVAPLQTTNYVATLTDGCTVMPATANVVVLVNPLPQVVFVPLSTEGCVPLTVDFQNLSSNGASWQWTFGDGDKDTLLDPSHTYTQPGTYSVGLYAVSNAGCENQLVLDDAIQVYENPQATFTSNRIEASILDPWFEFRNQSIGASTYLWDFGDQRTTSTELNPMYVYGDTGTYQIILTATSEHQCSDTAYGEVHVSGAVTVYIPNAFTPNSDGRNELFSVSGVGYTELQMIIFDRWGNMLFNQTSSNPGWDGMNMFNNSKCQQGVYVYKVIVKNIFNKQQEFKGTVSLLR
ncbi:MAG: PKD domain-containing protein [Bacteroidia bacterium]